MAITYVDSTGVSTSSSTIAATLPSGVAADDLLLALVTSANDGAIAESGSSDWTLLVSETVNNPAVSLWYRVAGASEPSSWDFTGNFNLVAIVSAYRGVDTADPFDVTGTWSRDFGSSTVGVSITTTEAGVTLVGGYCVNSEPGSYTLAGTMSKRKDVQGSFNLAALGDEIGIGAAGVYTRNATATVSQWQRGVLTSLRPGATAPPAIPRGVIIVGSQPIAYMEV
jgi:hypothetical protein